jgi:uncharacterized protein
MPLAVCRYETLSAEGMTRAREVYPRHLAYLQEFASSGDRLLIGTFADPVADGSMAVFRDRAAAERFTADAPFLIEGVVIGWRILDWDASAYGTIAPER